MPLDPPKVGDVVKCPQCDLEVRIINGHHLGGLGPVLATHAEKKEDKLLGRCKASSRSLEGAATLKAAQPPVSTGFTGARVPLRA